MRPFAVTLPVIVGVCVVEYLGGGDDCATVSDLSTTWPVLVLGDGVRRRERRASVDGINKRRQDGRERGRPEQRGGHGQPPVWQDEAHARQSG